MADKYLEGEELTESEIGDAVRSAVWKGELVPILATSATKALGIAEFLDSVCRFLPSPLDGVKPEIADPIKKEPAAFEADPDGPLAAFVFKTSRRSFRGEALFVPGLSRDHQK